MNLVTFTELRTKSNEILQLLQMGKEIDLIHRSKVVGTIKPKKIKSKGFDAEAFMKITAKINHPILTDKEIEKRYRAAMMKKHGKHLSGHKLRI